MFHVVKSAVGVERPESRAGNTNIRKTFCPALDSRLSSLDPLELAQLEKAMALLQSLEELLMCRLEQESLTGRRFATGMGNVLETEIDRCVLGGVCGWCCSG